MKKIPLTQGKFALVDDDNYEDISKYKWHVNKLGYAVRKPYSGGGKSFYMHREIMKTPDGFCTDHINQDKLDNRKSNLRICLTSENMANRGKQKNNTSGFKGVFWSINADRWRAQITHKRKAIHLGLFDTPEDAAKAYNKAAMEIYGEYAELNKV